MKSGPRPALEISTVAAAVSANLTSGALGNVRIALGAVAATPLRARNTEAFLEGKGLSAGVIEQAAQIASQEIAPIDDVRASEWYRRHLAGVFVRRILENAATG